MDSGGADLLRGDACHLLDQRRIARAAQADLVREDDGAQHVVVAVHGVDAVEERNAQTRFFGVLLQAVVQIGPGLQAVAFLGIGIAAAEEGAEREVLDIGRIFERVLLGLGHLADLLVERHLREEGFDLSVV